MGHVSYLSFLINKLIGYSFPWLLQRCTRVLAYLHTRVFTFIFECKYNVMQCNATQIKFIKLINKNTSYFSLVIVTLVVSSH